MQAIADMRDMINADEKRAEQEEDRTVTARDLFGGIEGQTYIVRDIQTDDDEMNAFLFRLGCYSGEPITIISKKKKSCIVAIKDSRYTLDRELCEAIII